MHGALNDFVVLDNRRERVADVAAFGCFACDRHAGLGADQMLSIETSQVADAKMRAINADGSEAEMCGNGMRCVARYLDEAGEGGDLRVETLAGIIETHILSRDPYEVRLGMGVPRFDDRVLPFADARFVDMGNPHVVIFERSLDAIDLLTVALELQKSPLFPRGTNVHLAVQSGPQSFDVRHWERGVGFTMACGTGVTAVGAAAIAGGKSTSPIEIRVPGGLLRVEWDGSTSAYLIGPAERVLDGTFNDAPVA